MEAGLLGGASDHDPCLSNVGVVLSTAWKSSYQVIKLYQFRKLGRSWVESGLPGGASDHSPCFSNTGVILATAWKSIKLDQVRKLGGSWVGG